MQNDRDIYWQDLEKKNLDSSLEGNLAIVTGGGKGIGKAIVDMLLENSAHVVIVSRTTGKEVAESRENCEFKSCNVRNAERCKEIVEEVSEKHGGIDILVACAGMAWLTPIVDESEEFFDKVMETNFKGVRNFITASAPYIQETEGDIITLGSIWGLPRTNLPGDSTYSAGDAAIIKYSEVAAEELEKVDVNCISPALVDTDINEDMSEEAINEFVENYRDRDELLQPREVAEVAEYLLKSKLNQKNTIIDAGYTR